MPTIAQKLAFNEVQAQIARGEVPNMSAAARKAGYKPSTIARSSNLSKSKGWQELLATIDDNELMDKVRNIALGKNDSASLKAIDMLMKLKDRYPAGKLKVTEYDEEISKLSE